MLFPVRSKKGKPILHLAILHPRSVAAYRVYFCDARQHLQVIHHLVDLGRDPVYFCDALARHFSDLVQMPDGIVPYPVYFCDALGPFAPHPLPLPLAVRLIAGSISPPAARMSFAKLPHPPLLVPTFPPKTGPYES